MAIRPFLAILVCLAGLTVNNGIGAPKMGNFSLQHGSGSIWRAQFAFRTKVMWKVKCFGPSWISKNKDDLESQGDDLSKSLGSHASKNRFYRWNLPLKVTDKTSHFSLIWGGGYRNKSLSKSLGAAVFLSFGSSGGPLGPLGLLDEQKRSRWRLRIQNSENVPFWV